MKNLILLFFSVTSLSSPAQDSLTVELARKYSYPIHIENRKLSGEGWALLKQKIETSQFIVLGENHYSALLSMFTTALLNEIAPVGYTHFVLETGPVSIKKIYELFDNDSAVFATRLHQFFDQNMFYQSPPAEFFNMKADVPMIQAAVKNNLIIKSIDKETYGSTFFLLNELKRECKTKESQMLFSDLMKTVEDSYAKYVSSAKKIPFFSTIGNDSIHSLMLLRKQNIAASVIVDELSKAWRSYGLYETGQYLKQNEERLKLMKTNIGILYQESLRNKKPFKALVKIGNVHSGRGLNAFQLYDVGNTMSELAALNNSQSLHIMNMRRYRLNDADSVLDFYNNGYEVYPSIITLADKNSWILIDMVPLRTMLLEGKLRIKSRDERTLILSHDVVLLTPVDLPYKSCLNYTK